MTKHKALPDPFGHPPKKPAKYELAFYREGKLVATHVFAATYSAFYFFDAVASDDEYKWRGEDSVYFDSLKLLVRCDELEEILEHTLTPAERAWELPEPYLSNALRLRTGHWPCAKCQGEIRNGKCAKCKGDGSITGTVNKVIQTGPVIQNGHSNSDPSKTLQRVRRMMPDGLISLAEICKRSKLEPREARQWLRKNAKKPAHGAWAWSKTDAVNIEKQLKGAL